MRVLRKLLKALAWLAGGLVALVAVIYLVMLAINWHDRPPSDAARRFAAAYRDRPAVADADNAFVYAGGFLVKPGDDPQAAGVRRIVWLRNAIKDPSSEYFQSPEKDYDYKSARTAAVRDIVEVCRDTDARCVSAFEQGSPALSEWSSSERWLFERYLALTSRPGWLEAEPFDVRTPLPPYAAVMDGQRLLFVNAWMRASEKDASAVRGLLSQDIHFWRHTLESSDILITKMIAVAALKRHFKFGNLVLRRLPADLESTGRPPEWAEQLTLSERSMTRVWIGEWMFLTRVLEQQMAQGRWDDSEEENFIRRGWQRVTTPFLQPQDLSNEWADAFARANVELDVPYERYRAGVARAAAILSGSRSGELPPMRFYNPIGGILRWINGGEYASYGKRVVDVEGVRRAALLTSELRSRGIAVTQVPEELSASLIRDPYTGESFSWDARKRTLSFNGLELPPRGIHGFIF